MTTIGLIGAGNIGSTIATLARDTGHDIVLSNSRGPDTLQDLATRLGPHVRAGDIDEAAGADIVVVTVPLGSLGNLPTGLLQGKVVIDTMNYYPERDGRIPALDAGRATTSQLTAEHFDGAQIVKGFNNIVHLHLMRLSRPHGAADRSALPIASDHDTAVLAVTNLMDDLGYDALNVGPLAEGWRFEKGQPAYCIPYAEDPEAMRNSRPGLRPEGARPVCVDELRTVLRRAQRV